MAYYTFAYPSRDKNDFPSQADKILIKIAQMSGEKNLVVTSVLRSPEKQAKLMMEMPSENFFKTYKHSPKFKDLRVEYNKKAVNRYGSRSGILKEHKDLWEEYQKELVKLIKMNTGFAHVKGNAFDLDPSKIKNSEQFSRILKQLVSEKIIVTYADQKKEINLFIYNLSSIFI